MNEQEYMDYLEIKFLELAEESGVSYKKVEPGQGKVIIKENGVILGELGDSYPTEDVLKMLVKEPEAVEIEYTSTFKLGELDFIYSDNGTLYDGIQTDNHLKVHFESLVTLYENLNSNAKKTHNIESHTITTPTDQVSFDECSTQVLLEAS
ncbi:hypothetical protein [Exiguobacterium sp. s151]|uniref:hypothetical protein n=1 Tax=Exiguobacterium sp. s151 TaxID=2751229 RepID=UPI001BEAD513|nr:hypothetical protein [Exiguobacterium sp. s151]